MFEADASSNSGSSDQSDSDNDHNPPPTNQGANKRNIKPNRNKSSKNRNGKKERNIELSANEICKLLIEAVDGGLSEGLKWLAENLEEVALDQEAEGYDPDGEGTPLVPISSDSVQAMDSNLFKKILKGIGMVPPVDEQETYWRIPSKLHFETIRKRREIILRAINRELIVEASTTTEVKPIDVVEEQNNKSDSSDDDDLFEKLRKMRAENLENSFAKSNSDNNMDDHSSKKKISGRKRRRSIDSSEENSREKMQKIDEADDEDGDDDNILLFAKKTLQHTELPDTEDILLNLPKHSDDSDKEDDAVVLPGKRKKVMVLSDEESD